MKIILLIVLSSFYVFAEANEVRSKDLEVKGKFLYKIGEKEKFSGVVVDYYTDGKTKRIEFNFIDGLKGGLSSGWYKNGKLKYKMNFVNGKNEGVMEEFHENGQIGYRGNYKNNIREGLQEGWYNNGEKKFVGKFFQGKRDGLHKEWYANKNKRFIGAYNIGKKFGVHTRWFENGKKSNEMTMENNLQNGKNSSWYETGAISSTWNAEKGAITSKKRWDRSGKFMDGVVKGFYENGNKKSVEGFKKGLQHGEYKNWYANGKIHFQGEYKDGAIIYQKWWDEKGVLTSHKYFNKDGKFVVDRKYTIKY